MPVIHDTFGRHILLDVWSVSAELLNDLEYIRDVMLGAAQACGATIIETVFHRFPVQGLSGVVVLAESHISAHTHPEHGYASFDVFTCGTSIDPRIAGDYIVTQLGTDAVSRREFLRGQLPGIAEAEDEVGARLAC